MGEVQDAGHHALQIPWSKGPRAVTSVVIYWRYIGHFIPSVASLQLCLLRRFPSTMDPSQTAANATAPAVQLPAIPHLDDTLGAVLIGTFVSLV